MDPSLKRLRKVLTDRVVAFDNSSMVKYRRSRTPSRLLDLSSDLTVLIAPTPLIRVTYRRTDSIPNSLSLRRERLRGIVTSGSPS